MKKIFSIMKKALVALLLVVFFGGVVVMTVLVLNFNKFGVTEIQDSSVLVLKNRISSATYKMGDIVLVKNKKLTSIKPGDEIFTYKVLSNGSVTINVGEVSKTHPEEDAITYTNGETYSMKFVIGSAYKTYPKLGTYLAILETRWGFFFAILVPTFFIFISQIYSLILEIKYGSPEEDEPIKEKK